MSQVHASGHVVVIHYPGLARMLRLMDELMHDPRIGRHARFVLVDPGLDELPPELVRREVRYVRGDPTRDETLQRAQIDSAAHALVLSRTAGDAASDAHGVAVTLAIEARSRQVNTVVECVDPATQELLRKAGCDRIVCVGRFDTLYISQELLNPGTQDVVAELLSTSVGQQFCLTPLRGAAGCTLAALQPLAAARGHVLVGVQRAGRAHLNPGDGFVLADGDEAITIGAERLPAWQL